MGILANLLPKPKAKRATVQFCPGVTVDGYKLLRDDEFRVGIYGASLALGYSQQWLYQLLTRGGKTAEALSGWGFSNFSEDVEIVNMGEGRGRSWATTISLTDFNCLINYAAVDGRKPQARGLLRGLSAVALEVFFRDAFGIQIDQSVTHPFYQEYVKGLCWTDEDRQDVRDSYQIERYRQEMLPASPLSVGNRSCLYGGTNNMGIIPESLGGVPKVHYANVVFGGEIAIDGYQFPDGEIRYGIQSAPGLAGLGRTYLSDLKRGGKAPERWKALQGFGFQARSRQGKVVRKDRRGKSVVETISGSDLDAFIRFAAEHLKKPKAIALLGASFSEVRRDRERSAFGLEPETPGEKIREFVLTYDRVLIANARAALDDMGMDDNYNAPYASNWQGDNPDNDSPVYENPWD